MAQRKHSNGFKPRQSYHEPRATSLVEGSSLTPKRDVEGEREAAIALNPITSGYIERYGAGATQPRVRYTAYTDGWADAYKAFASMIDRRVVPFRTASPMVGGFYA